MDAENARRMCGEYSRSGINLVFGAVSTMLLPNGNGFIPVRDGVRVLSIVLTKLFDPPSLAHQPGPCYNVVEGFAAHAALPFLFYGF